MKRQGVRGRDEESYLHAFMSNKKPMRKEVAKNKEITSTLLKHRHTSVPRTTCTGSSVCNRTIGVSSALCIKLELYVAQHEKKIKFMNMCLHIAYAFSTESDAVYLFSEQVFSSVQQIICYVHNLCESPQDQHIYVILCINLLVVVLHREDVAHRDTKRIRALLHL